MDSPIIEIAYALNRIAKALEESAKLHRETVEILHSRPQPAAALEGKTSPSPQTSVATGLTENAAPRAAAVIDLVTQIPYDTVRKAVLAYQDAKGVHAAQEVLKGFGVKYINELKARPERYQEVLDKLK